MVSLLDLGPGRDNPRVFNVGERGGAEQDQIHDWGHLQAELTFHDSIVAHAGIICTARIINLVGYGNAEE